MVFSRLKYVLLKEAVTTKAVTSYNVISLQSQALADTSVELRNTFDSS